MVVYRIILDPGFPMNIRDYRDAHMIPLTDAHGILDSFPFQEPASHIDDDPAPHILFANVKKCCFLMVTYTGKGSYQISFGKEGNSPYKKADMKAVDVKAAISHFWNQQLSAKKMKKLLLGGNSLWDNLMFGV